MLTWQQVACVARAKLPLSCRSKLQRPGLSSCWLQFRRRSWAMCQVVARGFRQDGMLIIRSSNYCGWSHSLASGEPRATLHQTRNPWAMWSRARSAGRQLLRGALGAYCAPPTHPGFQRSAKGCSWDGWARQPARSCISIETRMGRGRIGVRHATRKPTKCCLNNSVNRIVLHAAPLNVAPWHVVAAPAYGFF